jgi:hypothetical protein
MAAVLPASLVVVAAAAAAAVAPAAVLLPLRCFAPRELPTSQRCSPAAKWESEACLSQVVSMSKLFLMAT